MKIFNEKLTKVGAGGSLDPVFRRMAVRMGGRGKAISSGSHFVISGAPGQDWLLY